LGNTVSDLYESRYTYFKINTINQSIDDYRPYLSDYIHTLTESLQKSVKMRMISDRPIASLLSGGLDSSVIAGLVHKELLAQGRPPLKTFSIGMAGSKDLEYARMCAKWMGYDHTEIIVTPDEMFECIPDVIRDIESYDITTIRASVGNWMVAREIARRSDCKVVFNGDGSDELFGSYLYFFRAKSNEDYNNEVRRLLTNIHKYDVLRSDRCVSSHGLEARTPYLDSEFVQSVLQLPTDLLKPISGERMEKWLLREVAMKELLCPTEVALRRKEAFSDGVSGTEKPWYEIIQDKIKEKKLVPENWRDLLVGLPDWVKPQTEEAFYYYSIYCKLYPHTGDPWPYWMPQWSPETADPSARTLALY
jgi:asparagine synthase (glutamine-hydrolysing)